MKTTLLARYGNDAEAEWENQVPALVSRMPAKSFLNSLESLLRRAQLKLLLVGNPHIDPDSVLEGTMSEDEYLVYHVLVHEMKLVPTLSPIDEEQFKLVSDAAVMMAKVLQGDTDKIKDAIEILQACKDCRHG